jgi:DNA-binding PadR family transcriptional regulator
MMTARTRRRAGNRSIAETGPARRYYQLTGAGRQELRNGAERLRRQVTRIERFFELYEELQA